MGLHIWVPSGLRSRCADAPRILLFAQAVHVTGDAAVAGALAQSIFFAAPVGEARVEVALYLGLAFAPYALLSPVATRLLGRGRRLNRRGPASSGS